MEILLQLIISYSGTSSFIVAGHSSLHHLVTHSYIFLQPPSCPVKQAFLIFRGSKLVGDETKDLETEECAFDTITKKDQLENIFRKLRSKVDTSSI